MINAFVLFESVFDDDGNVVSFRFVFINDAYERITGVKNDEVRGKTMHEVWPGTEASWITAYSDVALTGVSSSFEMYHEPTKKLYYCNVYRPGARQDRICVIFEDITERKRVEETLRKSEEKFRNVFDWANDAILLHTLTTDRAPGCFIDANLVACRMLGYSRDELLTMGPPDIVPPECHPQLGDIIRQAQIKDTILFETWFRRKDGTIFQVESSVHLVNYEGKRIWISHIRDITERKRIEAAFQTMVRSMVGTTGLNSLQKITENVSSWLGAECVMVGEIQPDNQTVRVLSMLLDGKEIHDFSYTLKGTPCDNVVEKGFCLYPDNVIQLFPESKELIELNIRGYIGTPLRNSGGKVMGILCALFRSPITTSPAVQEIMNIIAVKAAAEIERKRAEETLRESEERFRSLFDSALDMIQIIRPDGSFLHVNPAWKKTLGYSDEDVRTMSVFDVFHPDSMAHCSLKFRELLGGAEATNIEAQFLTKDKKTISVEGNCNPELKDGTVVSIRGIFHDITERKQNDLALRQANKQLNLLSSITRHDILNQLMALKGYLELSHEVIDNPTILTEYITKEEKAANTIEAQITFTKVYQELGAAAPAWQNVNASIKKAVAGLPMRAVHVGPDPTDPEVYADPLFEKVFYNLIDNALKYGGDQMKTIRVSSQESDTRLTIVCEDDGVGITAVDKKHLFTRGFGKNTGLGLFLSREILGITGITITENGIPGKGARFEITVPKGAYRFAETGQK
jgi:PAS domain S-box-containing protein